VKKCCHRLGKQETSPVFEIINEKELAKKRKMR
jgi:hypothetical protein